MPELEEVKEQQVTYARFEESDETSADFKRKLNQYVYDNLPLTPEQKVLFRTLCVENAAGARDGVCDLPSIDEDA